MVQFCPNCQGMMYPDGDEIFCKICGYRAGRPGGEGSIVRESAHGKRDPFVSDESETLPRTKAACPECGHDEAYWHIRQIRAADEAPTRFYRCVRCKHTWRESD